MATGISFSGGLQFSGGYIFTASGITPAPTNDPYWQYVSYLSQTITVNNAQNNTFLDSSTNNFAITRNGETTQGSFAPFGSNWSNYFNGSSDYLTVANNAALTSMNGSLFTAEAWFYSQSTSNGVILGCSTYGSAGYIIFQLSGVLYAYLNGGGSVITGPTITQNAWNHVALVYDGTNTKLYLNGTSVGTPVAVSPANVSSNPFVIGGITSGTGWNSSLYFTGYISNVRVVKGVAVYTDTFTVPTSPLAATQSSGTNISAITNGATSLLTLQSPYLQDNSVNAFTVTVAGTQPQTQRFSPFSSVLQTPTSYATYFNGSSDYLTVPSTTAFAFGTSDFTVEMWIYPTSYGGYSIVGGNIFGSTYGASTGYSLNLGESQDRMRIISNASGTWADNLVVSTGGGPPLNTWSHIAWVRSGNSMSLYKNGVSVATTTGVSAYNFTSPSNAGYVGLFFDGSASRYFPGYISNIRVVKGVAVYTGNFTVPTSPLEATQSSGTNISAITGTQTSLLTVQSSTLIDNSTNAFTITASGSPTPNTVNPFGYTTSSIQAYSTSVYGGSMYFDGTGDYLTAPTNAAFSLTGNFTIECWLYPTAFTNYKGIWSGTNAINATGFHFGLNAAGNIFIYSNGGFTVTSSNAMTLNAWNHVAVVRNSGVIYIYINGVLSTNSWTTSTSFTNAACVVGTNPGPGTEYYFGYISNLRIVNGTAVYTSNFVSPTSPLTAITNTSLLLNGTNAGIYDASMINNQITVGNAQTAPQQPYAGSYYSNYFNGSSDYLTVPTNAALNFGSGDFTIEAWINPANLSADWFVISASGSGGLFFGNKVPGGFGYGRSAVAWDYNAGTITTNVWQHVALTRSGTSIRIFINGIQQGTTQTSSQAYDLGVTSTTIGSQGPNLYFPGYISNLRVIKGTAVYTSNFTPSTTPLTAISGTSLLTCQSNKFIDNSTNTFTITPSGTPSVQTAQPFGGSYYSNYFTGGGQNLAVASNTALNLTGDFTVECWAYATTTTNAVDQVFSYGNFTIMLYHNGTTWTVEVGNGGSNYFSLTGTASLSAWHHFAITRNANTYTFWIDGVQASTNSNAGAPATSGATLYISRSGSTNSQWFTGYISNFRIVKGTAVYTSTFTPPTEPLTAISGTSLLTCQSSTFIDNSTNAFTITTSGAPTVQSLNPFATTQSMYFDGTSDGLVFKTTPNMAMGTGDFTVEFWFYPSATQANFTKYFCSGTSVGSLIIDQQSSSNTITVNNNSTVFLTSGAISNGVWTYVAVVRSGTTLSIYLNGTSSASVTNSTNFIATDELSSIGSYPDGTKSLNGYLTDLRITKGYARYTTDFTPPTQALPNF